MPRLRSHTHFYKPHKPTHKPKLVKEYAYPTSQRHCKLDTTSLRQKEGQHETRLVKVAVHCSAFENCILICVYV